MTCQSANQLIIRIYLSNISWANHKAQITNTVKSRHKIAYRCIQPIQRSDDLPIRPSTYIYIVQSANQPINLPHILPYSANQLADGLPSSPSTCIYIYIYVAALNQSANQRADGLPISQSTYTYSAVISQSANQRAADLTNHPIRGKPNATHGPNQVPPPPQKLDPKTATATAPFAKCHHPHSGNKACNTKPCVSGIDKTPGNVGSYSKLELPKRF